MGSTQTYPKRPKMFVAKFVRLLAKACVANELGAEAFALLTVIAATEDARGYRGPVNFWNGQLAPLIGCRSDSAFKRVRAKCERAGWLVCSTGTKWSPPSYWVVVPATFDGWDDGATDEGTPDQGPPVGGDGAASERRAGGDGAASERQAGGERPDSFPYPSPYPPTPSEWGGDEPPAVPAKKPQQPKPEKPDPGVAEDVPIPPELDTPSFRAVWADWLVDRRRRRKAVTQKAATMQLSSLTPLGPDRAIECVQSSIANQYQGLFPDKFRPQAVRMGFQSQDDRLADLIVDTIGSTQ